MAPNYVIYIHTHTYNGTKLCDIYHRYLPQNDQQLHLLLILGLMFVLA